MSNTENLFIIISEIIPLTLISVTDVIGLNSHIN